MFLFLLVSSSSIFAVFDYENEDGDEDDYPQIARDGFLQSASMKFAGSLDKLADGGGFGGGTVGKGLHPAFAGDGKADAVVIDFPAGR